MRWPHGCGANPGRRFVPVQVRHAEVEHHDLRRERRRDVQRLADRRAPFAPRVPRCAASAPSVSAASSLSSTTRMRHGAETGGVCTASVDRLASAGSCSGASSGRRTVISVPWPGPSLVGDDGAAVHLDQPAHERQADARARSTPRSSGRSNCVNSSKICGSSFGAMPDAVVGRRGSRTSRVLPADVERGCGRPGR